MSRTQLNTKRKPCNGHQKNLHKHTLPNTHFFTHTTHRGKCTRKCMHTHAHLHVHTSTRTIKDQRLAQVRLLPGYDQQAATMIVSQRQVGTMVFLRVFYRRHVPKCACLCSGDDSCVLLCFIKAILGNRYVRSRGFIVGEPRKTHPRSEIADVPTSPCPP